MHVVIRLSPSRVEKFLGCPARWGFSELPGGVAEPDTEATTFGTAVHLSHELYYKEGKPHDLTTRAGWCANGMLKHLPPVLPAGGESEYELSYPVDGIELGGRLDLAYYTGEDLVVRDYKTTGSFRWAKLERDALFGHAQAPLYALMYMRKFNARRAWCGWVYAKRPPLGPGPWPEVECEISDHEITYEEAAERVHLRMVPPAKEMQAYADSGMTADDAGKLPKNLRNCRSFNRLCPYYTKCQPEKEQQMENPFLAGLGLSGPPPAPPAPTPPAADPTPPASPPPTPAAGATTAPDAPPAINPPEGPNHDAAPKGKGKAKASSDGLRLTASELDALADMIVDKLALRLVRNVK